MHVTDRVFLTWSSPNAVAASLPAAMVWYTVIVLFLGITSYVNTFVAQYHGAGRPERIGRAVWQGVWVSLACTPIVLATIPLAGWLFGQFGHSPEICRQEIDYYVINCYGAPPTILAAALASFFSGRGNTRTVMVVDSTAALVNVVLDYLWIFGKLGFPEAGIVGAAWATTVALWIKGLAYLVLFLWPAWREEFGTFSGCRWDGELVGRLLRFGGPSGAQMLVDVLAFTAFILFVGRLGEAELTATTLAFNVNTLAFVPMMGFGIAVSTLVGQRLGSNEPDLAARATWTSYALASAYMAVFAALYLLVPELFVLPYAYQADPAQFEEVGRLTTMLLRFVAVYSMFDVMFIVFYSAAKGAGDSRFVFITSVWTASLLTAGTWAAVNWMQSGLEGSWGVCTLWVVALGVTYLARFIQGRWRTMTVIEDSPLPIEAGLAESTAG